MSDRSPAKYIVSACLAGERCRYDGGSNTVDSIKNLVENGEAVAVCPEVLGGMPVPRVRCELRRNDDGTEEAVGEDGRNYTEQFKRGAVLSLEEAVKFGAATAVLKSKSPSCGCGLIYDGSFSGKLINGDGITARLFKKSGITVCTEKDFQ